MKMLNKWIICLLFCFPLHGYTELINRLDLELSTRDLLLTALFPIALPTTSVIFYYYELKTLSSEDAKIVLQASNDAVFFIATEGKQKSVYLEAAIDLLKLRIDSFKELNDYQIAMAIINFDNAKNALPTSP